MSLLINLVLAVFAVSPAIGLTTNVLVNLPLHVTHLQMQLKNRVLIDGQQGNRVSIKRLLVAAMRKTFHPLIMAVFGMYAVFSLLALCFILKGIYDQDYSQLQQVPATIPL